MKDLSKALHEWRALLKAKHVVTDASLLTKAETATFKTTQHIYAVLQPASAKEVSSILKIANKRNVPVYPVSGGKNWGLGSKVPQKNGVVIDLSRMKKITRFSEHMAYVTVEAGVTFKEAEQFLERKKSQLMLDTIGSTPEASIVGNTAERGHGMALYADRFNFVCGLEIVLPSGEIIETGFEGYSDSTLGPLAKWGVGPYLDGLFTQSNLGIITKLTLWLRAKPAFFQSFIFHIDNENKLAQVMERWRQMGLDGLRASLRVFNDMRMISFGQRFPENEKQPLSDKKLADLRASLKIGKWIGLGGLYAPSLHHAQADKAYIISKIGDLVDSIQFYDQASVDGAYSDSDTATQRQFDFMFNKSLLRGFTSTAGINMVYWRKSASVEVTDVHQDGCGVLWYCPAIPFTGVDSKKAIAIAKSICKKYGFELNLGFLFISERTLDLTGALIYDRNKKGEDAKAMQCHHELMETMASHGYSPYRLGIQSMKMVNQYPKNRSALLKALKKTLDPKNILAPGHYTT